MSRKIIAYALLCLLLPSTAEISLVKATPFPNPIPVKPDENIYFNQFVTLTIIILVVAFGALIYLWKFKKWKS